MTKITRAALAAPESTEGAPVEPTEVLPVPEALLEPAAPPAPVEETMDEMQVITRYDLDEAHRPKSE